MVQGTAELLLWAMRSTIACLAKYAVTGLIRVPMLPNVPSQHEHYRYHGRGGGCGGHDMGFTPNDGMALTGVLGADGARAQLR